MSCLNVKATLLNLPVVVGISLLSGIECSASVLNPPINISTNKVSQSLNIKCGLVCSVGSGYYLRVSSETVWLSPDELANVAFDIYSNVSWEINGDINAPYLDTSKKYVWVSMGELDSFDIYSNQDWKID